MKKTMFLLGILIIISGLATATGAITLDGTVSSGTADGTDNIYVTHTTGTGTDRLMLVGVTANSYNNARTISSVTFTPDEGSPMSLTEVGSVENEAGRLAAIYSLVDPPSGTSGEVTVTFSDTVNYGITVGITNFAGVDQSDPFDDFVSAVGNETAAINADVPTDVDDMVFDTIFLGAATPPSLTADASQTQLWSETVDRERGAGSSEQATTTTTPMSWTTSGGSSSYFWAIGAVPINPSYAGPTYNLTIEVDPEGSGTTTPSIGVYSYPEDTVVDISASPNTVYEFDHWEGACTGSGACQVTMDSNKEVTAHFEEVAIQNVIIDGTFSNNTADDVSIINISHTTGTGEDRLILVGISWNCGTTDRTISSVTFTPDGEGIATALDEVKTQQAETQLRYSAIYSLVNPPSGTSGTVTVTFSGSVSNGIVAGVANFANVDQTTPLGTPDGAGSGSNDDAPTVTLSGLNGNELVFDNVFQGASGETQTLTVGADQTEVWNSWIANTRAASSTEQADSDTVTMSWTAASASYWAEAAVPINPASVEKSTVTRSFSDNTPDQCSTLTVSLVVDVNDVDTYYAIDEIVPSGWVISDPGTGDTSEAGHIKWVVVSGAEDTTYDYDVTVPCEASGIYSFDGTYMFESDTEEQTILGETDVDVQEVECIEDDDCDYLDNDYCDGTVIMHVEGVCNIDYECELGTPTTVQDCNDGFICNGEETCNEAVCVSGTEVDCSANDITEVAECFFSPDDIDFTYDSRTAFTSECTEPTGECTTGDDTITHECSVLECSAECDATNLCVDTECDNLDGCVGNDYYDYDDVANSCLGDCTCEENTCTEYTILENDPRCKVHQVDDDKVECPDAMFTNIQDAVDFASAGDTITVCSGTYTEPIDIENKSDLTIEGTDKNTVIVKPDSTLDWGDPYGSERQVGIRVYTSTDIKLEDMTFDFDLIKGSYVHGILYWDSTGDVDNNIIKNMGLDDTTSYYEITSYFRAPSYSDTSRAQVNIKNNEFINTGRIGIVTHEFLNANIEDNTFYKTMDDFGYAIEMGSASTGMIKNNEIYGYDTKAASDSSESAGIYIENSFTDTITSNLVKEVLIENNEIYDCQFGMWIGNGYDGYAGNVDITGTVKDNNIHDSSCTNCDTNDYIGGILLQDEDKEYGSMVDLDFEGNTLNNNDYGYFIFTNGDGEIHGTFTGDTISNNNYGIYVNDFETNSSSIYDLNFVNNNIHDNTEYGIKNDQNQLILAENNYWGAADGPDASYQNLGSGDSVIGNVDICPFWDSYPGGTSTACTPGCQNDDDCNDLDDDYCDGTVIMHVEGVCNIDYECELGTPTTVQNCNNGLFCDGEETCDNAVCQAGTPPETDDNIDCTIDECDEINDQVTHTTDDSYCDDSLFCNGEEYCDAELDCQPGTEVECSGNNLPEIGQCDYSPDDIDFTYDSRTAFTSECTEPTGECTIGDETITHICDTAICGADPECDGVEPGTNDCDTECNYEEEEKACFGIPEECDLFTLEPDCESQDGCEWEPGECDGNADSCNIFTSEPVCEEQDGCNWEVQGVDECTGTPTPCNNWRTYQCEKDPACKNMGCQCNWRRTGDPDGYDLCWGTPISCQGRTQNNCIGGCVWTTQTQVCAGTETECDEYDEENDCEDQQGCDWNPAECDGDPTQCNVFLNEPGCISQLYCSWDPVPQCNPDHTDETGECNEYCGADSQCDGVEPGTNNCNSNCEYVSPEECYGDILSCNIFTSEPVCEEQDGCNWEVQGVDECTGTPTPCNNWRTYQCEKDPACKNMGCQCNWRRTGDPDGYDLCWGTPISCQGRTQNNCIGGCTWGSQTTICTGTATPCNVFLNEPGCLSQQSCLWGMEPQCNPDHTDETGECNEYCGADPECDGVEPGTNNCNSNCEYVSPCTFQCTGTPTQCNNWRTYQCEKDPACKNMGCQCNWRRTGDPDGYDLCWGTPVSCQGRTQNNCIGGCTWQCI